jgi:hypothetical protein
MSNLKGKHQFAYHYKKESVSEYKNLNFSSENLSPRSHRKTHNSSIWLWVSKKKKRTQLEQCYCLKKNVLTTAVKVDNINLQSDYNQL